MELWAVLGECGEYSDRQVWVSGVFDSEDLAKNAIKNHVEIRNTYEQYMINFNSLSSKYKELNRLVKEQIWSEKYGVTFRTREVLDYNKLKEYIQLKIGLQPEFEPAERFELIKLNLNKWNIYS